MIVFDEEGNEEGDCCNRNGCEGIMELVYDGPCICMWFVHHAHAVKNGGRIECSECGFIVGEDE